MAEPQTSTVIGGAGLLVAVANLVGPLAAEWVLVLMFAAIGAAAAAIELETRTLRAVWWTLVRGVLLALVFSAAAASAAAKVFGVAPVEILFPLAGLIGYRQDKLAGLASLLWTRKGTPS